MCGIIGYIGDRQAQPILLNCLRKLEYRGYDSCGIAVSSSDIESYKDVGRVEELTKALPQFKGTVGIGHTRWATHGVPNTENAHPHVSGDGTIALVHNGIIENYAGLKAKLQADGIIFT